MLAADLGDGLYISPSSRFHDARGASARPRAGAVGPAEARRKPLGPAERKNA